MTDKGDLFGKTRANPVSYRSKVGHGKPRQLISSGTEKWRDLEPGDYGGFMRLYVSERLEGRYQYIGGILVRNVSRGPQYYLLYGSNHLMGGQIMRDIMKKEHLDTLGAVPLRRLQYKTDREWLDAEYPLNRPFVFED